MKQSRDFAWGKGTCLTGTEIERSRMGEFREHLNLR